MPVFLHIFDTLNLLNKMVALSVSVHLEKLDLHLCQLSVLSMLCLLLYFY